MKTHFGTLVSLFLVAALHAAPPVLEWHSRGLGGGGALFSPSFSPHNPGELWLACDMSELFQTKDLGASWRVVPFREFQAQRDSFVHFTSDPNVLFALDYTSVAGGFTRRPSRSADGGLTWTLLANDPTNGDSYSFWADPASTQRLIINNYDTIFFSADGGTTWNNIYTDSNDGNGVRIAGVFWDGSDIFIGTNVGMVVSTDNGANFAVASLTGISPSEDIVSFAGGKTGNLRRFICATVPATVYNSEPIEDIYGALFSASAPLLYTLDWGVSTGWQQKISGINTSHKIPWVGMARNNTSVMWAAGDDAEVPVIYRSVDGGLNWTSVLITANNGNAYTGWAGDGGDRNWTYGGKPVSFSVSPVDATRAAFSDYGFCHMTEDSGATWKQTYVRPTDQNPLGVATPKGKSYHSVGLEDTTCWQIFFPSSSRAILCNSDIKGCKSDDGGFSWNFNYTGHSDNSMYRVVKSADGTLYAATSSVHDLYQSRKLQDGSIDPGTGKVLKSTTDGAAWTTLKDFGKPVIWVATDPTNVNRLYASVIHWNGGNNPQGGIWRTDDLNAATPAWTKCTPPPRTEGHPYNIVVLNDGSLVASFCARRTSGGVFTASSGVFYSTDQGNTWSDRSAPNMQYWTKDIVVDPHDPAQQTWYACVFNGWGGPPNNKGGLYRTTDRGQNWTQIFSNANMPSGLANVDSISIDPNTPGTAWMTTEIDGLWFTQNLNAASPTWEEIENFPFRQPTRVTFDSSTPGKVWVTTFGQGLVVGMSPLQAWREKNFEIQSGNQAIAGDLADPDGDGLSNLMEFAQNINPLQASLEPLSSGGTSGLPVLKNVGGWRFEFLRRTSSSASGITYIPEWSQDLLTWSPLAGTPQVTPINSEWERVSWPVSPNTPRWFARLRVTRP